MAISHIQPLVLFIASLFFLPALRAVDFENCNKNGYDLGTVTGVEVSHKPEAYEISITLTGFTKEKIGKGLIDVYAKSEKITDHLKRYDICAMGVPCPVEAGSNFVIPLTEIPFYALEGDYKYVVAFLDEESKEKLCIDFTYPASAIKMVSA
ncbi:hypothetical protein AALP_AA8G001700 [Arabis alpina]|uniref:MD-2-related lipid-recognition domain-containing protein n=1 Tax=Arabis alpina TaxID=50452 RepID=A0A087G409_ARAAL|nr:hypothetical protein AALP_AA8G001700 [Arabis alpina]